MKKIFFVFFILGVSLKSMAIPFMEENENLKSFLYNEPKSHFFLGTGFVPMGLLKEKVFFSLNMFQLHYIRDRYDIEIFSASLGMTINSASDLQSRHFLFRTSPKISIVEGLSVGPVLGMEYMSVPNAKAKLYKPPYSTPKWESFSTKGIFWGAMVSENYRYNERYLFKMNQVVYKQTYPVDKTDDGWRYLFQDETLQENRSALKPGWVILFEFSVLY